MKKENSQEFEKYIVERKFLNQKTVKHIIAEMAISNISANKILTNDTKKPYNCTSM